MVCDATCTTDCGRCKGTGIEGARTILHRGYAIHYTSTFSVVSVWTEWNDKVQSFTFEPNDTGTTPLNQAIAFLDNREG